MAQAEYWAGRLLNLLVRDMVITREEIQGMMEGRLCVEAPPLGKTELTDWLEFNRERLGRRYASELSRRTNACAALGKSDSR